MNWKLMKKLPFWIIIFLLFVTLIDINYAQEKVIFDTDIGPDWDDVGATATLHALANSGEAENLAMNVSSGGHSGTWGPGRLPWPSSIETQATRRQRSRM